MPDARDTLLLAFDKGLANAPRDGEQWLFLNALALPNAQEIVPALLCEQGFRSDFLQLKASHYQVEPAVEDNGGRDGALMLLTRSRQLNELLLARAWQAVKPGGVIVVAGANNDGAKSLRKHVARHCGEPQSLSKHHAIAFSFVRQGDVSPFPPQGKPRRGAFEIAPGMFSANGPDEGSLLLSRHFDARIDGEVADFGAGWGFLGAQLFAACPGIERLHSIEADHASLAAARINVLPLAEGRAAEFHWLDIVHEPLPQRLDWVVMNPPFHEGRAAQPELGMGFIGAAQRSLKHGGRLLMVANKNLPYEAGLAPAFAQTRLLADDGRYKVFEARRL